MHGAQRTWGRALANLLRPGPQRGFGRALLVVVALVGSAVALPNLARAHDWEAAGLNGAKLYLERDGYPPEDSLTGLEAVKVEGEGFVAADVAQIFQCRAGETDPIRQCQLLGAADTSIATDGAPGGDFRADIVPGLSFVNANGEVVACRGGATRDQCSIVAATFGPTTAKPTSMAEHYLCMRDGGIFLNHNCVPGPQDPGPTTTTTAPANHASMALSKDDQLDVLADVILVTGTGFVPESEADIFQCLAGATDPRAECALIGVTRTDAKGEFGPLPVPVTSQTSYAPLCAKVFENQCSIVAGTFSSTNGGLPTARAENYICFFNPRGVTGRYPCTTQEPTASVTTTSSTTTSTTLPPPSAQDAVADFDGDGSTDVSVFRPSEGMWYVEGGAWTRWGADGDIPVPGDYDGDGAIDVAIFRPETGLWAIRHSGGGPDLFMTYGIATDTPVVADYDGDGKSDIAIYRPEYATWWVHRSSDGADTATTFGLSTDVPVPADYDGDGKADLGIFRDGTWFAMPSSGGSYTTTSYGAAGDIPAVGDYDGDTIADHAVFRPAEGAWYLLRSSDDAQAAFSLGAPGDMPVAGDYDGDGDTDAAVFRPADGTWSVKDAPTVRWGTGSDIALPIPYSVRKAFFG